MLEIQGQMLMIALFAIGFFLAPFVGDYCLQSDWMANAKTKRNGEALIAVTVHAAVYTACHLVLTFDWRILLVIFTTHWVIDHYRLARHVGWLKNFLAPPSSLVGDPVPSSKKEQGSLYKQVGLAVSGVHPCGAGNLVETHYRKVQRWWHPWNKCSGTGYHADKWPAMSVWLMIITDNVMHLCIHAVAFWYFLA